MRAKHWLVKRESSSLERVNGSNYFNIIINSPFAVLTMMQFSIFFTTLKNTVVLIILLYFSKSTRTKQFFKYGFDIFTARALNRILNRPSIDPRVCVNSENTQQWIVFLLLMLIYQDKYALCFALTYNLYNNRNNYVESLFRELSHI